MELCNPPRFSFLARDGGGRLLEIAEVSSSGACAGCTANQCTQISEGLCEATVTTTDGRSGTASVHVELVWRECCPDAYPDPEVVTVVVQ